jgi:hypothetical protein
MFMAFAFVLLVLSVPLARGRLSLLGELQVRQSGLVVLALALQVLMTTLLSGLPHGALIAVHLVSYAAVASALWANRALPGLLLITLGGGTNAAVISLNGGTLPARPAALVEAGFPIDPTEYKNSGVVADPVLAWLGDIAATPAWLPFRNVISIGDVVVLVGAAVLLHVTCRTRVHRALTHRGAHARPLRWV